MGEVVTPDSFSGPYCLSSYLGQATCSITDQYKAGGLIFSSGVGTASFNDPPHAWAGINADNIVDLVAPVNGYIVVPGTDTNSTTDFLSVEAGFADVGVLLLQVFDLGGNLIGSRANGLDGVGPHSRTLMTISVAGIHSFSVSTSPTVIDPLGDTFGVDQIELGPIEGQVMCRNRPPSGSSEPDCWPPWFASCGASTGGLSRKRGPRCPRFNSPCPAAAPAGRVAPRR